MSYQREREDFIAKMVRHGMSTATARLLLRHAQTYHRLSERECNGDDWCGGDSALAKRLGLLVRCPLKGKLACTCGKLASDAAHQCVTRSSVRMAQIERRVGTILEFEGYVPNAPHFKFAADFQGDPRGYVLKIAITGQLARDAVGVPTRGV